MRRVLLSVLGWLALAAPARADEPPEVPARVILRVPACEGDALPWGPDFVSLFRVELTGEGVDELITAEPDAPAPGEHVARIELSSPDCGADQHVTVSIDDVLTHKRVSRTIDLAEVDAALRPRALSLFVIELLRAAWAELVLPGAPPPSVPVPSTILAAVRAREPSVGGAPAALPLATGEASALVLAFPGAATALLGGELGLLIVPSDLPLVLRAEAFVAAGEAVDRLGRVSIGAAGGGLGVGLGARFGDVVLDVGPLLRAAVGWAAGTPTVAGARASAGEALVMTLALQATLRVRLVEGLSALVGLELGAPVVGLEASVDGAVVAGMSGALLGARVGLSLD